MLSGLVAVIMSTRYKVIRQQASHEKRYKCPVKRPAGPGWEEENKALTVQWGLEELTEAFVQMFVGPLLNLKKGYAPCTPAQESATSPKAFQDENEPHSSLALMDHTVTVAGANPGFMGSSSRQGTKSGHGSVCLESQHWEAVKN